MSGAAQSSASVATSAPAAMRKGSIASAGRPDATKCSTCRLVASEQLPDTTALSPEAAGSALAADEGAMPKLAGSPIATPEPAVTSGIRASAGPRRSRSSFETASTIAMPIPSAFSCAMRSSIACAPRATTAWSMSPTLRRVCACSTRTRLGSVIGVSGWFCMPLSLSSTSPANR